jgi:hypothetical protein
LPSFVVFIQTRIQKIKQNPQEANLESSLGTNNLNIGYSYLNQGHFVAGTPVEGRARDLPFDLHAGHHIVARPMQIANEADRVDRDLDHDLSAVFVTANIELPGRSDLSPI